MSDPQNESNQSSEDSQEKPETSADAPASKDSDGDKKGDGAWDFDRITVSGQEQVLTRDEILRRASEASGAQARFEEASKIERLARAELAKAEKGLLIQDVFERINSGDATSDDVRQFAEVVGADANQMVQLFEEELNHAGGPSPTSRTSQTATQSSQSGGSPQSRTAAAAPAISKEDRAVLDQARRSQADEAERKIQDMVEEAVDKDEFFGKLLDRRTAADADDEERQSLERRRSAINSMVFRNVREKIMDAPRTGEQFGAGMIRNAIQTVRAEVQDFGIPSAAEAAKGKRMNLMRAFGSSTDLPHESFGSDGIKRVSGADEGYADNAVKRLGQKILQSALGRK